MLPLAWVASAQAPGRAALHWVRGVGAESCIEPRDLAERVEAITGLVLVAASSAGVSIEAQIARNARGSFVLRARFAESAAAGPAARVLPFVTGDCRTLDGSIALVIATMIAPGDERTEPPDGSDSLAEHLLTEEQLRQELSTLPEAPLRDVLAEPAPARTIAPTPPTHPVAPVRASRRQRRLDDRWRTTLVGGAGRGSSASASASVAVSLARTVSAFVALNAQLRAEAALSAYRLDDRRSVVTQELGVAILACARALETKSVGLRACLGPELGLLMPQGRGFMEDHHALLPSVGALTRLDIRHGISTHWGVVASAHLQLSFVRSSVEFTREGEDVRLFEAEALTFGLAFGVSHDF
jgi:hypothetical protein